MGLFLLRPMSMRAGRGRKATVRRKTRRRRSKKTEEGDKHLLWGRRRNSLTDNFTLAVYMRFLVAADTRKSFRLSRPRRGMIMALWRPDPTFYPSPTLAMQAPAEKQAFVAMLNPTHAGRPDALGVVDVDPGSTTYGQLVGQLAMPNAGDELHHFGWNACSSCLCPYAPHPHME